MLRVSPFYDQYMIRIRASCHNNTAPPIKLNKLSCSNMNMILLKHSYLIGQLNVPKLVSKMHVHRSGVYLYRVPTVGRPTLGFWVVPGPDSPLFCCALPISTRPPVACLAGDLPSLDDMTLGGDAGLIGGQEPLAQQRHRCPGAPPCLPSQSVQGSGMQHPPSQPDLS